MEVCKKHDKVSKSSTEAEYRAMSAACSEIVCLRGLLSEPGFPQTTPTPLNANNTSAIRITEIPFSMKGLNTLRWIAISFVMNLFLTQSACLTTVQVYKLQTYSQKDCRDHAINS